jgi:hypothetical protein
MLTWCRGMTRWHTGKIMRCAQYRSDDVTMHASNSYQSSCSNKVQTRLHLNRRLDHYLTDCALAMYALARQDPRALAAQATPLDDAGFLQRCSLQALKNVCVACHLDPSSTRASMERSLLQDHARWRLSGGVLVHNGMSLLTVCACIT